MSQCHDAIKVIFFNLFILFFFFRSLSDLKLYVMEEIHWEEVDAILSFLAAASDSHIVRSITTLKITIIIIAHVLNQSLHTD